MASINEKTVNMVKESMQRCLAQPEFLDRFYDEFMRIPEVRDKFLNTNMAMQKIVLKSSLYLMLNAAKGSCGDAMNKLAISHDRNHRNIPRSLYDLWLNAMIGAVKATDINCTPEIENAWREVMKPGIDYMIERY